MSEPNYLIITCPKCWRESFVEEERIVECVPCGFYVSPNSLRLMRPWGPPHCIETFCRPATEAEIERERNLSKAEWCRIMAASFVESANK